MCVCVCACVWWWWWGGGGYRPQLKQEGGGLPPDTPSCCMSEVGVAPAARLGPWTPPTCVGHVRSSPVAGRRARGRAYVTSAQHQRQRGYMCATFFLDESLRGVTRD